MVGESVGEVVGEGVAIVQLHFETLVQSVMRLFCKSLHWRICENKKKEKRNEPFIIFFWFLDIWKTINSLDLFLLS